VEAFRQRTPVVARNLGALVEVVEESAGGLLYDTEEDLREAMDRLLADPSYGRRLGQRGYEAYRQNWTVEAHLRRYLSLIDDLAARRSGSSTDPRGGSPA
jgi:glycosyltransferase involved in cell wall biosynthesis